MTITYPDGAVLEALVLAQGENMIRVAVPGEEDVRTLTRTHGNWISEDCEPVVVEFAWQRRWSPSTPTEADCTCSKALSARLIAMLSGGFTQEDAVADAVYAVSGGRSRVDAGDPEGLHYCQHV